MRLWSIHPKYLDTKGLLALWRESLLAQKVLIGKTKGYRNHPQLERFNRHSRPLEAIGFYLYQIYKEGKRRKYKFKKDKIVKIRKIARTIKVSRGQIIFEVNHLVAKLKKRNGDNCSRALKIKNVRLNPLFTLTKGTREPWDRYE